MARETSTPSVAETSTPSVAETSTPVNEMEIMEEIYLHKLPGEGPTKFVGLNGKAWSIPRGKKWKVPKPIAGILKDSDAALEEAEAFSDAEKAKAKVVFGAP